MDKLLVIYETMEKKEIARDNSSLYVPNKKEKVSFKNVSTNLPDWVKEEVFEVEEVEFKIPDVVIVRVWHKNY